MDRQHFSGLRGRATSGFLAALIVVGACGGSDASPTSGSPSSTGAPGAGDAATTAAPAASAPATTVPVPGELPPTCSVISVAEMADILGNAVTTDDSFDYNCYYEASGESAPEMDSQLSAFSASAEECAFSIPTEATLPGEVVEPAPDYGDVASLTTTEFSAEYAVCTDGLAVGVTVRSTEDVTAQQRLRAAGAILDLLLERL